MHQPTGTVLRRLAVGARAVMALALVTGVAASCGARTTAAARTGRSVTRLVQSGDASVPGDRSRLDGPDMEWPNPSLITASAADGAKPGGSLTSVSCLTPLDCEAVGSYLDSAGHAETLAEVWNGADWAGQRVPGPAGATVSTLDSVSCTGPDRCEAVGDYFNRSGRRFGLAEDWNGTTWSIQATPALPGADAILVGVSCARDRHCEAVGYYKGRSGSFVTLAEGWNGTAWTIQATPDPVGAQGSFLLSVSCPSGPACEAVADYLDKTGAFVVLAERWNGATWTVQTAPNPGGPLASLWAVSCAASTACEAVGEYTDGAGVEVTLAEGWNGRSWRQQTTPNQAGAEQSLLESVACAADHACEAVGEHTDGAGEAATLAEAWDGRTWEKQTTAGLGVSATSAFESVSCPTRRDCEAVGATTHRSAVGETLAEGWINGAWSVQDALAVGARL